MIRRLALGTAFGMLLIAFSAGSVLAHECYIASRSDQGNIKAGQGNPNVWYTVSQAEIFGFIAEETEGPELTAAQLEWAAGAVTAAGAPSTLTIFIKHTIPVGAGGMAIGRAGDGKGIDLAFSGSLIDTYIAIYAQALES